MIIEIGHYALVLALATSLLVSVLPMIGARRGDTGMMQVGTTGSLMLFGLVVIAFAVLTWAYVVSDFSVMNVWENSHSLMPLIYKYSGVWGNHEGSMLLWLLILTLFSAMVAAFGRNLPETLKANVLAVQSWIATAFLVFILFTSNPFTRLNPAPAEGQDLNPVLQDLGLAVHPPLLYLGYVGFSVCFSFAVAALIEAASMPPGRAGCGPGRSPPGASSRPASPWAPTGPITSSAGAAGGSGIRSKTPPSCHGLPGRHFSTRPSSWKSARP